MAKGYKAKDIEVLEGLEPVRKRPGMYIGGTDGLAGLHHLVAEILDNSIDEAMNGHASKITVTLDKDSEGVTVEDNGRGIPVDKHPKYKKTALELILTTLHAGGKFSDHNYISAGGLHGVGASVVNALSVKLVATIWRDGYEWTQEYSQGKPKTKIKKGSKTKAHGTQIYFKADPEIFKKTTFSAERLEKMLEEKAFLNKGLELIFVDQKTKAKKVFKYNEGLVAFLKNELTRSSQTALHNELFSLEEEKGIKVELAFCWTESTTSQIRSYVNGIRTANGGTHEDGFKSGLSKAVRNYIAVHDLAPKGVKFTGDDIR